MLAEIAEGLYILADLVIVTKSASQESCWQKWGRGTSAGRYSELSLKSVCEEICWQKLGEGYIYWQI